MFLSYTENLKDSGLLYEDFLRPWIQMYGILKSDLPLESKLPVGNYADLNN